LVGQGFPLSLQRINDFTAEISLEGAKNLVKELVKHSQTLSTLPRRNPIEPSLVSAPVEYRFLLKWNYKIIYTILETDNIVLIVLIFDTRQNPRKLKL
jgi:plasmid stabilization system protein ParE